MTLVIMILMTIVGVGMGISLAMIASFYILLFHHDKMVYYFKDAYENEEDNRHLRKCLKLLSYYSLRILQVENNLTNRGEEENETLNIEKEQRIDSSIDKERDNQTIN